MEILTTLKDTPIPIILVVTGFFFLALAAMTQIGWKIKMSGQQQKMSLILGGVLLLLGISLYLLPGMGNRFGAENPPTILGVTIREGREEGEPVIYQEINFYDDDGNTNRVEWELIDLSDPAQSQYIPTQNGVVNALPELQKIRATVTRTWFCEGRVYDVTLEVSLLDKDDNRSESVRYMIRCK